MGTRLRGHPETPWCGGDFISPGSPCWDTKANRGPLPMHLLVQNPLCRRAASAKGRAFGCQGVPAALTPAGRRQRRRLDPVGGALSYWRMIMGFVGRGTGAGGS